MVLQKDGFEKGLASLAKSCTFQMCTISHQPDEYTCKHTQQSAADNKNKNFNDVFNVCKKNIIHVHSSCLHIL